MQQSNKSEYLAHLLSVGSFGRAVAGCLRTLCDDVAETTIENDTIPLPQTWPPARINLIAAWRPVPNLCDLLDELSFESDLPFVPLIVDSTVMRVGPIVMPGQGSCWGCWVRRSRQHEKWPKEQAALSRHYATHADAGPLGYLEPFALMGAARLVYIINALKASSAIPGYVWEIDIVKRRMTSGTVVGVHDCPRCGLHRDASRRSFAEMQCKLAYLWPGRSLEEQEA